MLIKCIEKLTNKVDSLSADKDEEKIEERLKKVKVEIPEISDPGSYEGRGKIKKWLGELSRKIFSRGFRLYKEEEVSKKQKRAFCC